MTGPQWFPGADTSKRYDDDYPGDRQEVNVVVWHSTEGTGLPTYGGGASAPTLTAMPDFKAKRLRWYQHFPFDMSARALRNAAGGVDTNTLNVAQVEVVGTCDPATHKKWADAGRAHLYMADLPDWVIRDLAAFVKWAKDAHGVPATSGLKFAAYPGSYGTGNSNRMTGAEWTKFNGHCGHQHAPENDHGDPGAFPMAEILAKAAGGSENPSQPKQDPKPQPQPDRPPTVSLRHVVAAARRDPGLKQGGATYKAEVLLVEKALDKLNFMAPEWVDGSFGTKALEGYARLQRHLGYRGNAADGIPGEHSLTWLGLKTGLFRYTD